ncbi:DUF4232 domain-containing protein [Actinacidiphila paucisporea]|uniref:DUF4232 domain-containing protein n=1 Tax=Actinacidiphila paucisporea TaxID=310782 RepID=UPI0009A0C01A|nr:DUF4232 domain-containing protein [Actinacidiphila paucisporea]
MAATVTLLAAAAAGCGDENASGSPAASTGALPSSSSAAAAAPGTPGDPASGTAGDPAATGSPVDPQPAAPTAGRPPADTSKDAKPQARSARCTVTGLKMTLGRGDPGAGSIYFPLNFTNTTSHPCTLDGFPGVSLLRGDGSVIGRPAVRRGGRPAAVRIAPGRTVEADLHTLNQGVKGNSCWRKPTLIMVYPPGSTDSMTLATSNPVVCGDTFDVGPVH